MGSVYQYTESCGKTPEENCWFSPIGALFLPVLELHPVKGGVQAVFLQQLPVAPLLPYALRIDVNSEFEVLYAFLDKLPHVLAPGGRVAILTFHSGEDRMVKKSFKQYQKAGLYSEIAEDVIRPSAEECVRNSRARSTKLRWAVKAE